MSLNYTNPGYPDVTNELKRKLAGRVGATIVQSNELVKRAENKYIKKHTRSLNRHRRKSITRRNAPIKRHRNSITRVVHNRDKKRSI